MDTGHPGPGIALAAVADETGDLLPAHEADGAGDAEHYGPVRAGETLSEIVPMFSRAGVTPEQMMIAVLRRNPQAFDDNINILYEDAMLEIPSEIEMRALTRELAAAEVLEQTNLWQTGRQRHAALSGDLPDIMAAAETPPH